MMSLLKVMTVTFKFNLTMRLNCDSVMNELAISYITVRRETQTGCLHIHLDQHVE